ncbi:NAD-dependent epimerase/dehydratase family protein [Flindersiella endophytica]
MRVLVTGGRGFIGGHIIQALHAAGHEAAVFDLADSTDSDVRNQEAVEAALAGVDAVCHQAAKVGLGVSTDDLPDYASHNDVGTAVLLAAMARAGLPCLVLAGSMVIYGEGAYTCPSHGSVPPGPRRVEDLENGRFEPPCPECGARLEPGLVTEEARPDPRNAYATSKLAQEHYAANWARATGGRVAALRYHNVYGPGLPLNTPYAGVAALFRSALRRGESPRVFEDGGQRRDFVHVRDIAAANVAALEAAAGEGIEPGTLRAYNVGSGTPRTVGDLAGALAKALGGPDPVVTGEYRLGDVRHITASSERIRHELGWKPQVAFENGIAELAAEETAA